MPLRPFSEAQVLMAHISDFTVDSQGGLVGRGFTAGHKYEWELYCAPGITELDECQVTAMAVPQGAGAVGARALERSLGGKDEEEEEEKTEYAGGLTEDSSPWDAFWSGFFR